MGKVIGHHHGKLSGGYERKPTTASVTVSNT